MINLEVVREEGNDFIIKVPGRETLVKIENTFAEIFSVMEISPAQPLFLFMECYVD